MATIDNPTVRLWTMPTCTNSAEKRGLGACLGLEVEGKGRGTLQDIDLSTREHWYDTQIRSQMITVIMATATQIRAIWFNTT